MESRFPEWLKKRFPSEEQVQETRAVLERLGINTVCQSAICPNLGECFAKQTATFMIMGDVCTRNCRFCAVNSGKPMGLDSTEPKRIAQAVLDLKLKHVVITSVTRDDLTNGGAEHFAETINAIKAVAPEVIIEVLIPDFKGKREAINIVIQSEPNIFNHNVETVAKLYDSVRPQAEYQRSLEVLHVVKELRPKIYTKSGLMVGLGETKEEVLQVLMDLRSVECDIVTIGQYLQPSSEHLPIQEFIHPEVFDWYKNMAQKIGFLYVSSGPFVRSSYHAEDFSQRFILA